MEGNLIIVESPAKAGTIQKFLGKDFVVKSSFGHIRDLSNKKLGIDIENNFEPDYVVSSDKKKVVTELKKAAKQAQTVWLASDEDREGEAISWHLFEALGLKKENTKRIVFHEITKEAITNAIKNPREIDKNLVDAQQARRVLDRLVGFQLSPILWRRIQPKLSAGRVQSVALRLIVDREREIIAHKAEAFYKVSGEFLTENSKQAIKGLLDTKFNSLEDARTFLEDCKDSDFKVASIESKEGKRTPAAPFTTSTLQQEAARKLRFSVSQTMRIAQSLYEKGLITYMRTDSTNLSKLALGTSKQFIIENFGTEYAKARQFRTKSKGAQEAHEAIRPTYIANTQIEGTAQEKKLYELIWKRTIASQMSDAKVLNTNIKVQSSKRKEKFAIHGNQILFDGFLKVYIEGQDDVENNDQEHDSLPIMEVSQSLKLAKINADCKFTSAPYRYSEATLVKKLEELGIGRPSTYSPTISTLTTGRGYVVKGDKEGNPTKVCNLELKSGKIKEVSKIENVGSEKSKLLPAEIGMIVSDFLVKNFEDIVDYDFTASVEKEFDEVAEGKCSWNKIIADFYSPFIKKVEETLNNKEYSKVERELGTDDKGNKIVAKFGPWGAYVQKGEDENKQYSNLGNGQLIENITLEEALKLFELPRVIGKYKDIDIIATKGRFGPYLKYGDRNISLPRGKDPLKIELEECSQIVEDALSRPATNSVIKEFKDEDIQVLNGRYGAYIKYNKSNYKIPKDKVAEELNLEECQDIIKNTASTSRKRGKFKK